MPGPFQDPRLEWDPLLAALLPPGMGAPHSMPVPGQGKPLPAYLEGSSPVDRPLSGPIDPAAARPLPPHLQGAVPEGATPPPEPPQPAPAPEVDPVAQALERAMQPQQQPQAPAQAPPYLLKPRDAADDGMMFLSILLDMALNKGRGGGDIMKFYQGAPDRELDRAHKEAEINRLYAQAQPKPAGGGDDAISRGNLALRALGMQQDNERNQGAAALQARKQALDSPETKAAQEALIAIGYDEQAARQLSAAQIELMRPQLGTSVSQERGNDLIRGRMDKGDRIRRGQMGLAERYDIEGERRGEDRTLRTEGRESERSAEANAIPGYKQIKRVADQDARTAREFAAAIEDVEEYSTRLEELQKSIGARGLQGTIANITDPEAADTLAEAKLLQINLDGAIRKLQNWGVPQQYELELLASANPPPDSWRGVLSGGRAYRAQARIAASKARRHMRTYGYEMEGEQGERPKRKPAGARPSAEPGALSFDPADPLGGL
jgi:hypothetical protein